MNSFEILEHTADIGFRATAGSLPELFESAAEALVATAMELDNIEERESYALAAEGDSRESLLVNWLSDVLYQIDGQRLALRRFKVHKLDSSRVSGEAYGEPRDPKRHPGKLIVKGITYHQLRVERDEVGWFCEVYLDI
jgi:SHS2 domain-containing protein